MNNAEYGKTTVSLQNRIDVGPIRNKRTAQTGHQEQATYHKNIWQRISRSS